MLRLSIQSIRTGIVKTSKPTHTDGIAMYIMHVLSHTNKRPRVFVHLKCYKEIRMVFWVSLIACQFTIDVYVLRINNVFQFVHEF